MKVVYAIIAFFHNLLNIEITFILEHLFKFFDFLLFNSINIILLSLRR
jgi:hypothetical protein